MQTHLLADVWKLIFSYFLIRGDASLRPQLNALPNLLASYWFLLSPHQIPWYLILTSCARGDTICLRPLQVDSIFAFIRQMAVLFRHNNIFIFIRQVAPVPACWLFKTSVTSWPLTFWKWCPSHMCDVGYLCASFSLPRLLCSRVRPDVRDRQTDRPTSDKSIG